MKTIPTIIAIVFAIIITSIINPTFEEYSWLIGLIAFGAMYKIECVIYDAYKQV